jgi:putative serine protease PepD
MTENEWARTGHVPPSAAPSTTLAPPPPTPPWGGSPLPDPPRRRSLTSVVVAASLAGLVGAGVGFGGAYAVVDGNEATTLSSSPPSSPVTAAPGSVAGAAQFAMPSTVDIKVRTAQGGGEGSGVVLTADGAVLTNNHVVAGASDIAVTLADGTEHTATVVGTAPSYDLAVIRIAGVSGLTPATLGSSADLKVGQQVVAIGSPQGLSGTVTTGIVSSLNRTVAVEGDGAAVVYNGLQTDAAINPGNSGGPLVDLDGRVVGINSAIATTGQNGGNIGLGFAIPVDTAHRVAQEILADGTASKPVLGVAGSTNTGDDGAVISSVDPDSGAAKAGLAAGDVVTKVGGAKVEDFADLVARIGAQTPGGTVELTVRGPQGAERPVTVTLGSTDDRAASTAQQAPASTPFGQGGPFGR